jgi:hypothetical protein
VNPRTPTPWVRPPSGVTGPRAANLVAFTNLAECKGFAFVARQDPAWGEDYLLVACIPHAPTKVSTERALADADYIVRAANAHEAFLSAGRAMLAAYAALGDDIPDSDLDDEQPKHLTIPLGAVRALRRALQWADLESTAPLRALNGAVSEEVGVSAYPPTTPET